MKLPRLDPKAAIGGIATGPMVLGILSEHGVSTEGFRWEYGGFPRTRPFRPHQRLDGVQFANFDDEVLRNPRGGFPGPFFLPGDHKGCKCDFVLDFIENERAPRSLADALNEAPVFKKVSEARAWRKALMEEFADDPAAARLQRAVSGWQGNRFGAIRRNAETALRKASAPNAETAEIMNTLNSAAQNAPSLYRGNAMRYPPSAIKDMFRRGSTHDIPLSSFTRDEATGRDFARGDGTPVFFRLRPGARAINVEPFSADTMRLEEREFISGGRFRVTGVRQEKQSVVVDFEQIETFAVPG